MKTNDFMVKSLFVMFGIIILGGMISCIIRECNRTKVYANPKQVIRKERIGETSESEIWRTSNHYFIVSLYVRYQSKSPKYSCLLRGIFKGVNVRVSVPVCVSKLFK